MPPEYGASAHEQILQPLSNLDVPWRNQLELLVQELISGRSSESFACLGSCMRIACTLDRQSWKDNGSQLKNIYEEIQQMPLNSTRTERQDSHDAELRDLQHFLGTSISTAKYLAPEHIP